MRNKRYGKVTTPFFDDSFFFFILGRYFRLQCKLSHCIPCEIRYPKCEDKEDGLWPQHEREITPFYMICENNRLIYRGYCQKDSLWGIATYPYNGQCVHRFAIPKEFNGYLPSCKSKADGNYQFQDPTPICNAYYKCDNGTASAVLCPNSTVFDSVKRNCEVGVCTT